MQVSLNLKIGRLSVVNPVILSMHFVNGAAYAPCLFFFTGKMQFLLDSLLFVHIETT